MTSKELVAATGNMGKLRELRELLEPLGIKVFAPAECGIAGLEVEETGNTFEENAMIKAVAYAKAAGMPAVADDSGLMVDALDGAPGIYSARYGGEGHDDAWRVGYLLSNLVKVPDGERGGRFVSALAYATPLGEGFVVRGECEGLILRQPKGSGGFGYDPIFLFEPDGLTFSQLSEERKNEVSHRGAAMRRFTNKLGELQ
jgi:XTP/dITP diphosphohydrolase